MKVEEKYADMKKPSWAPPSWLFGPVWVILYVLIVVSFGGAVLAVLDHRAPVVLLLPFFLNLIFNLSFTYIQFGMRNNYLAAADIVLCLLTLVWGMLAVLPYDPWIAVVNLPYLLWLSFATVLQLTITYLNRTKGVL